MIQRETTADGRGHSSHAELLPLGELLVQFYADLRSLARARVRRLPPSGTLRTGTLVHEAILRLQRRDRQAWADRRHFFADVKQAMGDIVVEYVRRKQAVKHGGHLVRAENPVTFAGEHDEILAEQKLALAWALDDLQRQHPQAAEIVILRYFSGMTVEECARELGIAPRSVARKWSFARRWLEIELSSKSASVAHE